MTGVRTAAMEEGDRGLVWAMAERNDSLAWAVRTRKRDLAQARGRRNGGQTWVTGGGARPGPRVQEGLAWAIEETSLDPEGESGTPA